MTCLRDLGFLDAALEWLGLLEVVRETVLAWLAELDIGKVPNRLPESYLKVRLRGRVRRTRVT